MDCLGTDSFKTTLYSICASDSSSFFLFWFYFKKKARHVGCHKSFNGKKNTSQKESNLANPKIDLIDLITVLFSKDKDKQYCWYKGFSPKTACCHRCGTGHRPIQKGYEFGRCKASKVQAYEVKKKYHKGTKGTNQVCKNISKNPSK